MSFCVSCGEGMDDGWKACPKCGAAKGGQNQDVVAPQIIQQPITMVAGEPKSSEYRQVNQEKKPVNPIAVGAGVACIILALPAAIIGLMELIEAFDYGVTMLEIFNSLLYTGTTLMILIGSGLFLTGVLNDTMKMGLGATLIAVSFLGLIRRIIVLEFWYVEDFFYMIRFPWIHEQLELSFLGMLIGIFIMNSVNRSRDVV